MTVLKDLLCHTAMLSQLSQELYTDPLEQYGRLRAVRTERVLQRCAELMDTLRALRQPKMVLFSIELSPQSGNRCVYNMDGSLHCCQLPA
jgi:hypothetical protein